MSDDLEKILKEAGKKKIGKAAHLRGCEGP
jgi:hypothetical protein